MPAFVRTPHDEGVWAKSKERAAAAGLASGSDAYWKYANEVFQRMKGVTKSRGGVRAFMRVGTLRFAKAQPHDILEMLAELEHEQWMAWTKAVAKRGVVGDEQVKKWRVNWVPYRELSNESKEDDRRWARKALARLREARLTKSLKRKPIALNSGGGGGGMQEREEFKPKGKLDDAVRARAVVDGHALIQRPEQSQPVAGRVVATGKDGIHLRDDGGRVHRVRHEHVLDHQPPVGEEEWLDAAEALHRQGIPIDSDDRFAQRVSPDKQALLDTLKESGVNIDTERLAKEGGPGDVEEVLERHINREPKPSEMPTVVSADREREAPGWDRVFPGGKGRVSRQRRAPTREYAEDNDAERDRFFDEAKATGMVSAVRVSPEVDPVDQEHLLRYAANALKSIADLVGPPNRPPTLVIAPAGVKAEHEEVGAHYNRRANELQIASGEPESIAHAYGHVFDAAFGDGKYASATPDGPLAKLLDSLRQSRGTADLDVTLATAERREEEPPDSPRRFWTGGPEMFARFFEQYVDSALGEGEAQPHHEYVRGVEQPASLGPKEMAAAVTEFKHLLAGRDKNSRGVRKITAEVRKASPAGVDSRRRTLLEEAKGSQSDVGKRLVSALTHGVHPRHLRQPPDHYTPEQAKEHRSIVRRAGRGSGARENGVHSQEHIRGDGGDQGGHRLSRLPDGAGEPDQGRERAAF